MQVETRRVARAAAASAFSAEALRVSRNRNHTQHDRIHRDVVP